MPPANISHRRTHNLLLISKLLSLRDNVSPLTLVLDSLEQPAAPLISEYIRRAKVRFFLVPMLPNAQMDYMFHSLLCDMPNSSSHVLQLYSISLYA